MINDSPLGEYHQQVFSSASAGHDKANASYKHEQTVSLVLRMSVHNRSFLEYEVLPEPFKRIPTRELDDYY
jgi:hypothetical protein